MARCCSSQHSFRLALSLNPGPCTVYIATGTSSGVTTMNPPLIVQSVSNPPTPSVWQKLVGKDNTFFVGPFIYGEAV